MLSARYLRTQLQINTVPVASLQQPNIKYLKKSGFSCQICLSQNALVQSQGCRGKGTTTKVFALSYKNAGSKSSCFSILVWS